MEKSPAFSDRGLFRTVKKEKKEGNNGEGEPQQRYSPKVYKKTSAMKRREGNRTLHCARFFKRKWGTRRRPQRPYTENSRSEYTGKGQYSLAVMASSLSAAARAAVMSARMTSWL